MRHHNIVQKQCWQIGEVNVVRRNISLCLHIIMVGFYLSLSKIAMAENNYVDYEKPHWLKVASLMEQEQRHLLHFQNTELKPKQSRTFAFDNDALVPGNRDQDYTYGINLTQTGTNVRNSGILDFPDFTRHLKAS